MKKIGVLQEYVKMVARGFFDSLIVTGKPGIGKSYTVVDALKQMNVKYKYHSGFSSPLALYNYLFYNNDKLIVFDDTSGILNNEMAMSVLNPALWPVDNKRVVSWNSSSKKAEVPEFEFKGKIIFICNKIPRKYASIHSRCMIYHLAFSRKEMFQLMREIASKPNKLTVKERQMIVDFIEKNTDESTLDLNLRTQSKIESIYLYDRKNWKALSLNLLARKDDKLSVVLSLLKSGLPVREQVRKWMEYGWSRRAYFLYKSKINKKSVQ